MANGDLCGALRSHRPHSLLNLPEVMRVLTKHLFDMVDHNLRDGKVGNGHRYQQLAWIFKDSGQNKDVWPSNFSPSVIHL